MRRWRSEGSELAPGLALRCAEEIARGDASAGWCVSIAITSSLLAAYLPAESRAELFGDGQGIAAGVWAPRGKARPVDGGLVVSGRWAFCSGIAHSDLLFAGCFVEEGADTAGERPTPSVVAVRKQDLRGPGHLAHAGAARHWEPGLRCRRRVHPRGMRLLLVRRAAS